MFRLRRYRVFLGFTAIVIGGLYYLATTRDLESAGASVQGLRNLSLKEKVTTQQPPTINNHFLEDKQDAPISSATIPAYHSPLTEQLSPSTETIAVNENSKQNPLQLDKQSFKDRPAKSAELNQFPDDDLENHKSEKPATPPPSPESDDAPLELSKNGNSGKHAAAPTSQGLDLAGADYLKYAKPATSSSSPGLDDAPIELSKNENSGKHPAAPTSQGLDLAGADYLKSAKPDKPAATTMSLSSESISEPYGEGRTHSVTDVPKPTIHWRPQVEHFPVPSQSIIPLPSGKPSTIPKIQHVFSDESANDRINRLQKLEDVKAAFLASWNGYKNKAWTQDELTPVSGGYRNPFCGWAATLVDSLDTLWIMGLKEEFEEATNVVKNIDFTISNRPDLPLFEVVIRYLGGLIAAYDLSSGTYRVLLEKAEELAEVVMGAFDTPNRMPMTEYLWKPYVCLSILKSGCLQRNRTFASQPHRALTRVVLAELGSLSVEFTRLAQLTRNSKYYDAIARITNELESWQNNTKLPGLWPKIVDASGCKKPESTLISQTNHSLLNGPAAGIAGNSKDLSSSKDGKLSADHSATYEQVSLEESLEDDAKSSQEPNSIKRGQAKPDHAIYDSTNEGGPEIQTTLTKELALSKSEKAMSNHSAVYGQSLDSGLEENPNNHAGKGLNLREANTANKLGESDARPESNLGLIKRQLQDKVVETTSTTIARAVIDVVETSSPTVSATVEGMPDCEPQGLASPPGDSDEEFTLGGQADSVYEYLPKQYMLLGGLEDKYQKMYEMAIESSKKYLFFRPMLPDNRDILLSGSVAVRGGPDGDRFLLQPEGTHLTCFVGGMLAIGAKIFDRSSDLDLAGKLTDGCVWAYEATTTGIMPEHYLAVPCRNGVQCTWNETKYEELIDPQWKQRSEQLKQRAEQRKLSLQRQQQLGKDKVQSQSVAEREKPLSEGEEFHHTSQRAQSTEDVKIVPTAVDLREDSSSKLNSLTKRQLRDTEDELPVKQATKLAEAARPQALPETDVLKYNMESEKGKLKEEGAGSDDHKKAAPVAVGQAEAQATVVTSTSSSTIQTAEEYFDDLVKIRPSKLPPGMTRISSTKYILRYVTLDNPLTAKILEHPDQPQS